MTTDKYIEMCKMYGDEISPDKIPPDISDFPIYVTIAIEIFNMLPDTYASSGMGSPIYVGKDISAITALFKAHKVKQDDKLLILDTISLLDSRARAKAIRDAKKTKK